MPRYVAFLRAINVGGRVVKMDRLRSLFEAMSFANVETFIASGNVVFDGGGTDPGESELRISAALRDELGYEVATFVRTLPELAAIADHEAFPAGELASAVALNVAFTGAALRPDDERALQARTTAIDRFSVCDREVFWLCRVKQSQSTFSNAVLEKLLGRPSTLRSVTTVARIVAKFG